MDVIQIIHDNIQVRLEKIGINSATSQTWVRNWHPSIYFVAFRDPCTITLWQDGVSVRCNHSCYGRYLYADPNFYTKLFEMVHTLSILDE